MHPRFSVTRSTHRRKVTLIALSAVFLAMSCSHGDAMVSGKRTIYPSATPDISSYESAAAPHSAESARNSDEGQTRNADEGQTSEVAAKLRLAPSLPGAKDLDDLAKNGDHRQDLIPVAVTIERLGLASTPVRAEGLEPNGEMSVPPPLEVGWYKLGSAPGEPGSAVLAGHVAYDGVNGAFRHLDDLELGDEIVVERQNGTHATFVVSERAQVAKSSLPFDEVFARSGPARLALITCGGDFDYEARSYLDNVVITAELVTPSP